MVDDMLLIWYAI